VEKFTVTSGTLTLGQTEGLAVHDINLEVSGFSNDRSCRLQGSARMFGNESNVKLDGRAGPFSSASLPFEGTVSVVVAPAEIPAGIRREQFGNLLMSPGAKARATLDASVRGDIYGSVGGPATVALTNVLLGPHPSHLLPISGKAPATFSARNLMSNAQFQIGIVSATMQLGNGQWSGSAAVSKQDGVIKTASRGAIRDIDINQLLSAFTTASGKVYGVLAIPSYSLEMSGRNADALRNSLRGGGKLSVTHGRLGTVDLPGTLERVLGQQRSADAIRGATAFDTLTSDLSIGGARINVENLVLDGSALRLTGSGVIGFDQSINFNLNARVTGGLARLVNTGPLRLPSPNADIPLTVTGTVESPQVHPQVGKLAKSAAEGILRNFIKKKLK
jgi:hypothetical protein